MRKIKLVVVALAATAGLLATPAAAIAAIARPAESVYTTSSLNRCFNNNPASPDWVVECVDFQAYSTYSATQVWINGHVACHLQTVIRADSRGYHLVRGRWGKRHGLPEHRG